VLITDFVSPWHDLQFLNNFNLIIIKGMVRLPQTGDAHFL